MFMVYSLRCTSSVFVLKVCVIHEVLGALDSLDFELASELVALCSGTF